MKDINSEEKKFIEKLYSYKNKLKSDLDYINDMLKRIETTEHDDASTKKVINDDLKQLQKDKLIIDCAFDNYDTIVIHIIINIIDYYRYYFDDNKLNSLQLELFMRIVLKNMFKTKNNIPHDEKLKQDILNILKNNDKIMMFHKLYKFCKIPNEVENNPTNTKNQLEIDKLFLESYNEIEDYLYSLFDKIDISNPNNEYGIQELDEYKGITKYLYKNILSTSERKEEINKLNNSYILKTEIVNINELLEEVRAHKSDEEEYSDRHTSYSSPTIFPTIF